MLKEKKSPGKYSKSFFRRRYPNSEDGMLLQNPFIVKKQAEIPAPGTLILIGTDGIWEAKNKTGDRFGKQRVKEVMRGNSDKSSSEVIDTLLHELRKFREREDFEDDITLVLVKSNYAGLRTNHQRKGEVSDGTEAA